MKTLADFKKRIQKGVKLACIFHQASAGRDENGQIKLIDEDRGTREVNIVQTNSFTLLTPQKPELIKLVDSWLSYPKASEIKIIDKDTILIYCQDFRGHEPKLIPLCTYKCRPR